MLAFSESLAVLGLESSYVKLPEFSTDIGVLAVLFRSVVRILRLIREECGLMPRQYSPQFRERVAALVQDGSDVRDLASELGIAAATI